MNGISIEAKLVALMSFIVGSCDADIVYLQEVAVTNLLLPGFNIAVNIDGRRRGTAIYIRTIVPTNH